MGVERDNPLARQIVKIQAKAAADILKVIGDPRTQRGDVVTGVPQIDPLEEFEIVHSFHTVRSLDEITQAVTEATVREEYFHRLDDSRTTHSSARINYAQGVVHSLKRATLKGSANLVATPYETISVADNKPVIIELLERTKADKILVDARIYDTDFIRRNPNWSHCLAGSIAGYEWLLGLRSNLGIDALTETGRVNQRLEHFAAEAQI
jgi:hypothetical protein